MRILRAISALCARAHYVPLYVGTTNEALTSGTYYPPGGSLAQNLRCIIRAQAHLRTILSHGLCLAY